MTHTHLWFSIQNALRSTITNGVTVRRTSLLGFVIILFTCSSFAQTVLYNNGKIRIGNGAENSINAKGNMQQPFYHNGSNWVKLTYSNIALNASYAIGGDGVNEWNTDGEIKNDPMMGAHNLDLSEFGEGVGKIISTGIISFSGTNLMVETTYVLLPESPFMKISVKLTNPGTTAIPNVRMWIGTRDDYVGITDNPSKQRGNLVDGQFDPLTDASKRGVAIRVTSGQEGVLLYADSENTHSILQNCCNWNNVINQNPLTAGVSSGSDSSYGLYFRFADLTPGESDQLTWYYAAGAIADFDEIIRSVAREVSPISQISCNSAIFKIPVEKSGTGYFMVVPSSAAPPTAPEIKAGVDYGEVTITTSGNATIVSGTTHQFILENLESATEYKVFFVLEEQPNVFSALNHHSFSTLSPLVINLESLSSSTCGPVGDGSIHTGVSGGQGPFTYLWSSGDTTDYISGKPAGEYAVVVNDASGCPAAIAETYIGADDMNPPVALTQPVTLHYDSTGTATLTSAQVNNGSYDDCGIDLIELSHDTFGCIPQGNTFHTVILTVFDLNGNMDEAVALVQVYDTIKPNVAAQNLVIYTHTNGSAFASAEAVDNGSTDNCTLAGKQLDKSVFGCEDLGDNSVSFTATDGYGNASSVDIIITVIDTIKPVVYAQNLVIELGEDGQANASALSADTGSVDNCEIAEIWLSKTNFDCSDLGVNTVWFTASDISGNETTKEITITVVDRIFPAIESPEEITMCAGTFDVLFSATTTDNCGSNATQISGPELGSHLSEGTHTIVFQATDLSGNTSTKSTLIHALSLPETTLDDTYEVLPGEPLQITSTEDPNLLCLWSTGDTTASVIIQVWEEIDMWVQVENETRCSITHEMLIKMRNPQELSGPPQKGTFLIYPNPAFDDMHMRFDLPEKMKSGDLMIVDAQGRILKKQTLRGIEDNDVVTIDIANLAQGPYHICLTSNGLNLSLPFVKY